jgi:hypothetical protein
MSKGFQGCIQGSVQGCVDVGVVSRFQRERSGSPWGPNVVQRVVQMSKGVQGGVQGSVHGVCPGCVQAVSMDSP